jgi:two-component system response regulator MprA
MTVRPDRVLVVDDDPTLRETLGEVLTDEGYEVRVAQNGRDALEELDRWETDLVILDVMMPVMDAYGFRATLAERRELMPPVILLSAAPGLGSAAHDLGAVEVIAKPFRLHELLEGVRRALASRSATADSAPGLRASPDESVRSRP